MKTLDPVTLAVLNGRLVQIADEMDATLFRAAFNRELAGGDGQYSRGEFTREFLTFMAGRQSSTSYDPIFSQE